MEDDEIRQAVSNLLMDRHPKDTPEWWRNLGPGAPHVLIDMYAKASYVYHRMRLLQGLGWFSDSPEAVDFIKQQAQAASDDVVRNTAIRSLGNSQGAKEDDFIAGFLQNADPQTRLAAAETLQKIDDPHARELVEHFKSSEKMPWVVGKLNGEAPKPAGPLTPVASSEDRVNPDFAGRWRGFWIEPKPGAKSGMESREAWLELKLDAMQIHRMSGSGSAKIKGVDQAFDLIDAQGKGTRIRGQIQETGKKDSVPFEGELIPAASSNGSHLMELHFPKQGGTLLLRRDPA